VKEEINIDDLLDWIFFKFYEFFNEIYELKLRLILIINNLKLKLFYFLKLNIYFYIRQLYN
jgi:hypothetical protein